jgi:hypothetical protein
MTLLQGNVAMDAALLNVCAQLMRADNGQPLLLPMQ